MEKLAEAFQAANPQVTVEVQQSDSTTGVNMAIDGTCDIGMASRELKDSETGAGVEGTAIALDGIAVIVAPAVASIDKLTSQQVCDIYTGAAHQLGRTSPKRKRVDHAVLPAERAVSECSGGPGARGAAATGAHAGASSGTPAAVPRAQAPHMSYAKGVCPGPVRDGRGPLHRSPWR